MDLGYKYQMIFAVAERLGRAYPALLEWAGVGSIPANSDAQNGPSFRRYRFETKLSPFKLEQLSEAGCSHSCVPVKTSRIQPLISHTHTSTGTASPPAEVHSNSPANMV